MSNYLPIQLPSKCLPYKGIKPEDILVRQYTGGDEVLLAQINPTNLERNFLAVLKNVIQGIEPERLTTGDKLYLIIWEYVNSYSNTIKVNQVCSHCLKSTSFVVDLAKDIQIAYLSDDYTEPQPVVLPESKETVNLRILTVKDELEAEKMLTKGQDPFLYRLACSITDCDSPVLQMDRMKNWKAKDVARIRKFHEIDTYHGPTSTAKVVCPKCGEEEEVIVPFRFEFLHPTGKILGECFGA